MKRLAIGIDIGGQSTKCGVVTRDGIILAQSVITSLIDNFDEYLRVLTYTINELTDKTSHIGTPMGIGIGAPNANRIDGTIRFAPNLRWARDAQGNPTIVYLADRLEAETGLHVRITNDANAAARGERIYGIAKGLDDFIMITLGTGVGSGIVVNGQLLYGHDGFAGELGHVTMVRGEEGRPCGCGRKGCLEAYCSATGVARTARELLMKTDRPSLLREMDPEKITSLDVSIAAGKGDELAKEIYEFTGKMLGEACADFAAFSSPEAFIFFGGMVKAGELIMKPIREAYEAHVLKIFKNKAQFLVSGLDGASAAVLGASAIGWEIQ